MGVVYLLKSECGRFYKYGATKNLKNRIKSINHRNCFGAKFRLLKQYRSLDIFTYENNLRWEFVRNFICLTEFFIAEESLQSEEVIVKIMEDVCLPAG